MKIDKKSAALEPLLKDIRALTLKHQSLLSSLDLKIALKSTLSDYDQVVDILVSEFDVPIEVVDIVVSYLSVTYLVDVLGAGFDTNMLHSKNETFESVQQELYYVRGYEINHHGKVLLFN